MVPGLDDGHRPSYLTYEDTYLSIFQDASTLMLATVRCGNHEAISLSRGEFVSRNKTAILRSEKPGRQRKD